MTITRVPISLEGFTGAPGLNVWNVVDVAGLSPVSADAITNAFEAFYTGIRTLLQSDVTVTIPNTFLDYVVASGEPAFATSGTLGDQTVVGTGASNAAHFVSAKVQLRTGAYEDGRELRGGPFIGPWGRGMNADGSLPTSTGTNLLVTELNTLLAALTAAGTPMIVYRAPRPASDDLPARDGSSALVTNASVNQLPAVQRRRRD